MKKLILSLIFILLFYGDAYGAAPQVPTPNSSVSLNVCQGLATSVNKFSCMQIDGYNVSSPQGNMRTIDGDTTISDDWCGMSFTILGQATKE